MQYRYFGYYYLFKLCVFSGFRGDRLVSLNRLESKVQSHPTHIPLRLLLFAWHSFEAGEISTNIGMIFFMKLISTPIIDLDKTLIIALYFVTIKSFFDLSKSSVGFDCLSGRCTFFW